MGSILIVVYALFSLNTAQINDFGHGEGMEEGEFSQVIETGDDIRVEIQASND
jgi:hypothetical protein